MNIYGEYVRRSIDENGDIELTFKIHNYRDKEVSKELEKEVIYKIGLTVAKSKRTLEQNALMWELIHEINDARGTNRANDDFDIYIEALQRAGVKTEYIAALPETEETLKKQFRAIQYCNSFEHKGRTFNQYRVFVGSSKMDKAEMTLLLDTVMDMASEVGVAPRISDYE